MEKEIMPAKLKLKYKNHVPYDVYFRFQQDKVDGRICRVCHQYFSVQLSLKEHKRICKKARNILEEDEEDTAQEVGEEQVLVENIQDELELVELRPLMSMTQRGGIEKIVNLKEWMKSPWSLMDEDWEKEVF